MTPHRGAVVGHAVSGGRDGLRGGRLRRADLRTEGGEGERKPKEEKKKAEEEEKNAKEWMDRAYSMLKKADMRRKRKKQRKKRLPRGSSLPRPLPRALRPWQSCSVSGCCLWSARCLVRQRIHGHASVSEVFTLFALGFWSLFYELFKATCASSFCRSRWTVSLPVGCLWYHRSTWAWTCPGATSSPAIVPWSLSMHMCSSWSPCCRNGVRLARQL